MNNHPSLSTLLFPIVSSLLPFLPQFIHTDDTIYHAVRMYITEPEEALPIYGPISMWNVSQVTCMMGLFAIRDEWRELIPHSFNEPLNEWDVSHVTNMAYMFYHCPCFNQPLASWNIQRLQHYQGMFDHADSFNQCLAAWKDKYHIHIQIDT